MDDPRAEIMKAICALADRYRSQCLWFCPVDYYPSSQRAALRVLAHIQRHGDLEAFREAGRLREWLLQISKDRSAAS